MNEPTHVDLFSGIGGFALAAKWAGFRTIAFCEIDKYCQKILAKNFMADAVCSRSGQERTELNRHDERQDADDAGSCSSNRTTIHGNIFDLDGTGYRGCDLITGGFPCQPFSVAGKRRGAADDRAIWPEMFRVIKEARPTWVLGENVSGIIPMELDNALSDLESVGYACRSFVIPACAVDAKHRRMRVWIVGRYIRNTEHAGLPTAEIARGIRTGVNCCSSGQEQACELTGSGEQFGQLAYARFELLERWQGKPAEGTTQWLPEPDVGRVAHGIPSRVDRLKGLGNAIVPQVAYEILREIRRLI